MVARISQGSPHSYVVLLAMTCNYPIVALACQCVPCGASKRCLHVATAEGFCAQMCQVKGMD